MKSYLVNGLTGRVEMDSSSLLCALERKLDFVFFVGNVGCVRCLELEREIVEHPGVLIFEISYREYQIATLRLDSLPFVYSFPTGVIVENGIVKKSDIMGEKTAEEFYEWLVSDNESKTITIDNPFDPVFAKDGTLRRYKANIKSICLISTI